MSYRVDDVYLIMFCVDGGGNKKYYIFNKLSNNLHESSPGVEWWNPSEERARRVAIEMFLASEESLEEIVLDVQD